MFGHHARLERIGVPLRKQFRLFFTVVAIVLALGLLKAAIHWFNLEFLTLNPLFTSAIAGAIFIIGFLLSNLLSDYKEAERLPADIRVALEAINDDVAYASQKLPQGVVRGVQEALAAIITALQNGLGHDRAHGDLSSAAVEIDKLSPAIAELEQRGTPANFIVRLRTHQDGLRRCVFRIWYIQKMRFIPSVQVLVRTLVLSVIFLLLFLKTEGSPESALLFGFIAYMFVFALHLINALEQPFCKGHNSIDDVSLFLLRAFVAKLKRADRGGAT